MPSPNAFGLRELGADVFDLFAITLPRAISFILFVHVFLVVLLVFLK
jgi:hypothetical protein